MLISVMSMLLQSSIVSSPALSSLRHPTRIQDQVASASIPRGTADNPVVVGSNELRSPETTVRLHKRNQEHASRNQASSIIPPLPPQLLDGCRKIAEHPRGFMLADTKSLNGQSSLFECGGYVAEIISEDLSRPLTVVTAVGFTKSRTDAVLNGGALARIFRINDENIKQLTYLWVGGNKSYTVALTSRSTDFRIMQRDADRILNLVTRTPSS